VSRRLPQPEQCYASKERAQISLTTRRRKKRKASFCLGPIETSLKKGRGKHKSPTLLSGQKTIQTFLRGEDRPTGRHYVGRDYSYVSGFGNNTRPGPREKKGAESGMTSTCKGRAFCMDGRGQGLPSRQNPNSGKMSPKNQEPSTCGRVTKEIKEDS